MHEWQIHNVSLVQHTIGMILLPVVCPAHNWDDLTACSMSSTQLR